MVLVSTSLKNHQYQLFNTYHIYKLQLPYVAMVTLNQ